MLDRGYIVERTSFFNVPYGQTMGVRCCKDEGVSLIVAHGPKTTVVRRIDPMKVFVHKIAEGSRNAWTGRHVGVWVLVIREPDGKDLCFLMRNKGDALHLKKWIERHVSTCIPT